MQIVMDNREADIGRFVRRHLSGLDIPQIYAALQSLSPDVAVTLLQRARKWLDEGAAKAKLAAKQWPLRPYPGHRPVITPLLSAGAWEVAMVIDPPVSVWIADNTFYQTVASSIPSVAARPIWVGTRHRAQRHASSRRTPFSAWQGRCGAEAR